MSLSLSCNDIDFNKFICLFMKALKRKLIFFDGAFMGSFGTYVKLYGVGGPSKRDKRRFCKGRKV